MGLFDRLEAGIERAVQGTFAKHLRSAVHPVEIASHIRRAMDDRAVTGSGRAIVPNVFTIELSAGDFDRLAPDLQNVEMDLVAAAEEHCEGQRYQPAGPIDIIFEEHDDLETGVFRIRPSKASRPRATGHTGQERAAAPAPGRCRRAAAQPPAPPPAPLPAPPVAPPAGGAAAAGAAGPPVPPPRRTAAARRTGWARPHGIRRLRPRGHAAPTPPTGRGWTSTVSATPSWAPSPSSGATTRLTSSSTTPASRGGTPSCG